jgi:hypothetical protein
MGVRWVFTRNIFSWLIAKFIVSIELGDGGMTWSAQNLERIGLTGKILQNKELVLLPATSFPVLGRDGSYCFWLNTMYAF